MSDSTSPKSDPISLYSAAHPDETEPNHERFNLPPTKILTAMKFASLLGRMPLLREFAQQALNDDRLIDWTAYAKAFNESSAQTSPAAEPAEA